MLRDFLAFLGTSITCASYIMAIGWLARHNVLEKHLSRKVMHIGKSGCMDRHMQANLHSVCMACNTDVYLQK